MAKRDWRAVVLIGLITSNVLAWFLIWQASKPALLTIAFLDVGQGDAIYIEAPNGNQLLIDAGEGKQILPALAGVMPFYDRSLDVVIATHPDADHIGGLASVLESYEVLGVMDTGLSSDTATYRAFLEAVEEEIKDSKNNSQNLVARAGARINLGNNVYLDILWPNQVSANQESNSASVVARLVYGETSALLTGDAPIAVERALLATYPNLQADILKVGHHGSKTSSDSDFLAQLASRYAIISAGARNRYGHPTQTVLDKLAAAGAQVLRTDTAGTVICQSNGLNFVCE
jgi:competence protein ComEC